MFFLHDDFAGRKSLPATASDNKLIKPLAGRSTGRGSAHLHRQPGPAVSPPLLGGRHRYRGVDRTQAWAYFVAGTYNLLRITRLGLALQAG